MGEGKVMNKEFKAGAKAVDGQVRVYLTLFGIKYDLSVTKAERVRSFAHKALRNAYQVVDQLRFAGWHIAEGGNYFTLRKGDFVTYVGRYNGVCTLSNSTMRGDYIAKSTIPVTDDDTMCAAASNWANRALGGAPPARLVRSYPWVVS